MFIKDINDLFSSLLVILNAEIYFFYLNGFWGSHGQPKSLDKGNASFLLALIHGDSSNTSHTLGRAHEDSEIPKFQE